MEPELVYLSHIAVSYLEMKPVFANKSVHSHHQMKSIWSKIKRVFSDQKELNLHMVLFSISNMYV